MEFKSGICFLLQVELTLVKIVKRLKCKEFELGISLLFNFLKSKFLFQILLNLWNLKAEFGLKSAFVRTKL